MPKPVKASAKRINVAEAWQTRQDEKASLNLVVVGAFSCFVRQLPGHVDAGKSTLMGHLLCLLGEVEDRLIKKYERESQKIGKGSFMYAWVLDETDQERERYTDAI
jgi:elongation factor 1 alpha-like protein